MHLLPLQGGTLDDEAAAVDVVQTPADLVVLSFSDGDLAALASAHAAAGLDAPSLRLCGLARLKHPFSVDLYVERVACRARVVLVRLLGGLDYWRYGAEELGAAARRRGFALALIPGCEQLDPRLDALSTLPVDELRRLWQFFREGGPANLTGAMKLCWARIGHAVASVEPEVLPPGALEPSLCRAALLPAGEKVLAKHPEEGSSRCPEAPHPADRPSSPQGGEGHSHALITFYRSALLAGDTAPVAALADALQARGARVSAFSVTSLKDAEAGTALAGLIRDDPPDVVLNTTAFSARREQGTVLDAADVPVLQVVQSASARDAWVASKRGLGATDLAMNVVLPEIDGRLDAGAVSFKEAGAPDSAREFAPVLHRPDAEGIVHAADLALAWAKLRRAPRAARRIAIVLSDYPGKAGRGGYAVGLDAPASLAGILTALGDAGFATGEAVETAGLMGRLTRGRPAPVLSLSAYTEFFADLSAAFRAQVEDRWGSPAHDLDVVDDAFAFRFHRAGSVVAAVQPDRGSVAERRAEFHDADLPPRHGYIAFYLWLRRIEEIHALVHLGTHGTLEWLPGRAVALGPEDAPRAVIGPLPVIYPFIVSDPGEAAQAKRRIGAVTIGHLTPPLVEAGVHGVAAELEALFDEYAQAQGLDARRTRLLGSAILDHARASGLADDCGIRSDAEPETALLRLDSWLCDLKEARIGDGLHVFGGETLARGEAFAACGPAEMRALIAALDGRFVAPGPAGSPARGRLDVLPTGRNMFAVDPRSIPTRTATEIGAQAAAELMTRHAQDHGEWPRRLVMDLWGSATMRTGGDDLAQALALIGVRPRWDLGSTRVNGFEILPQARLERPRVDVTLRISGLFRDTFPDQIALFDAAARAVATLDEDDDWNPLAAARRQGSDLDRVFGAAPQRYGLGLARRITADAWVDRADLGEVYLAGTTHAYRGALAVGHAAAEGFRERVRDADTYIHAADLPEVDLLSSDVFAEHQGGFAAAASALGGSPALYHADATREDRTVVRTLGEEVARVVRARATNPRWIAGQMRHGFRGAAEIAETVDALFAFAATTDLVPSRHFDLMFEATLGDDAVRAFLEEANPMAARAIATTFSRARNRGLWHPRRNATVTILADLGCAA